MACPHVAGLAAYFMGLGLRTAGDDSAGGYAVGDVSATTLSLDVTEDTYMLGRFILAVAGVVNATVRGELEGSAGLIANNLLNAY